MTSRERLLTTLRGGIPDRLGRFDSPWSETLVCWRQEGLREGEETAERFGFDLAVVSGLDISFGFPVQIVEDCDEYIIQRDADGILRKDMKRESGHTPHWAGPHHQDAG